MALDRPFDDSRVQTANERRCERASIVSANIMVDELIFMLTKRTLYFRHFRLLDEAADTNVSDKRGRPQSFTQAAPNELNLARGGKVVRAGHRLGGSVGG